jgi:hypothetical protein
MRGLLAISERVWPAAMLLAQGINPETTRALTEVSEMGRLTIRTETLPRSLTFEEGDDPTVASYSVSTHQPLPAARKAAGKAERLTKKNQTYVCANVISGGQDPAGSLAGKSCAQLEPRTEARSILQPARWNWRGCADRTSHR